MCSNEGDLRPARPEMGRPRELRKITMKLDGWPAIEPAALAAGGALDPPGAQASSRRAPPEAFEAAMANAPADPHEALIAAVADAKRLMRIARTGALGDARGRGQRPLTTLVGVASDFDGAPLFLLSTLSRHTKNLARDPRASLLLTGAP